MAFGLDVGKTDLIKKTFVLGFWVWIEDIELFEADSFNTQVEIGSTNNIDEYEIYWDNWHEGFTSGWNWVALKGADAHITGTAPDFDNLTRFRIYVNGVAYSGMKIDRISITHIGDEDFFTAPDWESEIVNKDNAYSGPNGYYPENTPYLDIMLDKDAEDFVALCPVGITGCVAGMAKQIPACIMLMAIACFALIKKSK